MKKKPMASLKIILGILLLLLICTATRSQSYKPVNINETPEAVRLLNYLCSLSGRYTLSGEHNFNEDMNRFSDTVNTITGKYPAVWGTDFIWNGSRDNGQAIVDEAVRKYKAGYIITLMWHQGRPIDNPPFGWKESIQGKLTDAEWNDLITPGTAINKRWEAQIDVVAGYLLQLKAAGIPVLWRPYHEMNGVWFWWGNRKGRDGIQKLWKMMYDRYVNHFHLNNLLWVWGANGPRDIPGDQAYDYADFYPGGYYVDILGADVYHMDYEQKDYNDLLALANGKLIALTECGELPNKTILEAQPKWSWFLVWTNFIYTDNSKERVKEIYDMPQVLSHDGVKMP
jgi:mannan endo-1,4-beta-mannosidase